MAADRRAERGEQLRGAGGRRGCVEVAGVQLLLQIDTLEVIFCLILKIFES